MTESWYAHARVRPVVEVAQALGLHRSRNGSWGPCPVCARARRSEKDRSERRAPLNFPYATGWTCHACKASGDSIDLAARVLFGCKASELGPRHVELRDWFVSHGWAPGEGERAPRVPPPPPPEDREMKRPPERDLRALNAVCRKPGDDPPTKEWMRSRGYDPALLADERTGARLWAMPSPTDDARLARIPGWAMGWQGEHRLLLPMFDAAGKPVSAHARSVSQEPTKKTLSPAGFAVARLFMANVTAMFMLKGKSPKAPTAVVVVEGVTDFLRASQILGHEGYAILGGISGSFQALADVNWPDVPIYLALDADAGADPYRKAALAALGDRDVHVVEFQSGNDFDDEVKSLAIWNELATKARMSSMSAEEYVEARVVEVEQATGKGELNGAILEVFADTRFGECLAAQIAAVPTIVSAVRGRIQAAVKRMSGGMSTKELDKYFAAVEKMAKGPKARARDRWGSAGVHDRNDGEDDGADGSIRRSLESILGDHDLPVGLVRPQGWSVTPDGVFAIEDDGAGEQVVKLACREPFLLTGKLTNANTGATEAHVEWYVRRPGGSRWKSACVPMSVVSDSRAIVKLSDQGVAVNSANARAIIQFVDAYQNANDLKLPQGDVTTRLGWHRDNGAFLLGRYLYQDGGSDPLHVAENSPVTAWPEGYIHLRFDDDSEGMRQIVSGFRTEGTWEGWLAGVSRVTSYDHVMLAMWASLVPPLLELVPEMRGFAIDWSADTSKGKTTLLRFPASVWGVCDENQPASIVASWSTTSTGIERRAALTTGLPVILDDTKNAPKPDDINGDVYRIVHGQGKTRGTIRGLQATATWQTVLLSTGETPITSIGRKRHGGAAARTLELVGPPFGEDSTETAILIDEATVAIMENFGHLGRRFLSLLMTVDHAEVVDRFRELKRKWAAQGGGESVWSRVSGYLASIELAKELGERAGLPRPSSADPMAVVVEAAKRSVSQADKAKAALKDVLDWAASQQDAFYGQRSGETDEGLRGKRMPSGGWLGRWDLDEDGRWASGEMSVLKTRLDRFLDDQGYDVKAVQATWSDRGYILPGEGRKVASRRTPIPDGDVKIGAVRMRRQQVVTLRWAGLPDDLRPGGDLDW